MDEPRLGWADRPLMARSLANPTRAALRAWVPVLCLKPNPLKRRLSGSEARIGLSPQVIFRLSSQQRIDSSESVAISLASLQDSYKTGGSFGEKGNVNISAVRTVLVIISGLRRTG